MPVGMYLLGYASVESECDQQPQKFPDTASTSRLGNDPLLMTGKTYNILVVLQSKPAMRVKHAHDYIRCVTLNRNCPSYAVWMRLVAAGVNGAWPGVEVGANRIGNNGLVC
jgi:hypothetical protein